MPINKTKFRVGKVPESLKNAIKFGRRKKVIDKESYYALIDRARLNAFSVSGDLSKRAISTILKSATLSLKKGQSFQSFKKSLPNNIFDKISAPEVVFKQSAINTYQRSRFTQQQKLKRARPFGEYVTFGDERVRPNHAIMHGIVSPLDSSFWAKNTPPNGFQCRCTRRTFTRRQINESGKHVFNSQKDVEKHVKKTQLKAGIKPEKIIKPIPDMGFSGSFKNNQTFIDNLIVTYKKEDFSKKKSITNRSKSKPAKKLKKDEKKNRVDIKIPGKNRRDKLHEFEKFTDNKEIEYLSYIDKDGKAAKLKIAGDKKLYEIKSDNIKHKVSIFPSDFEQVNTFKSATLIHNHTLDRPPSPEDIAVLANPTYKTLKGIYAVGKKYRYKLIIKKLNDKRPHFYKTIKNKYNKERKKKVIELKKQNKNISNKEAVHIALDAATKKTVDYLSKIHGIRIRYIKEVR